MGQSHPDTLAGRYQIREAVGEGNFSVTYRATDKVLGRDVAIKILREQYVQHAGFTSRFENEARAAALISHPNVIQVFDYGREDDIAFIVMQYVPGASLKDYIRDHAPLPVEESVEFTRQILDGLAAIHEAGIIHRDIKPQNVLMTDQRHLKLTDFGIARLESAAAGLTESGTALGTAAYMAPEQASGQPLGRETDLYAVGVILYEMTTGRLPFPGDNPVQVMYRHVNEIPEPPRAINAYIPVTIEAFILRSMSKNPRDRYPSARAMRDALVSPGMSAPARRREPLVDPSGATAAAPAVAAGAPPQTPPARGYTVGRERRRPWGIIAALAALLVVLLLVAAIALAGDGDDQEATPTVVAAVESTATEAVVAPTATETAEPAATVAPTETLEPTASPTVSPTIAASATPEPTLTPEPTVTPTPEPESTEAPAPTSTPEPPPSDVVFNEPIPLSAIPYPIQDGDDETMEAGDFEGAYRRPDGRLYGLPAVHLYGQGSDASTATASFEVDAGPAEYIVIVITGMDDEVAAKVPIRVSLNGNTVWEGASPFGNEDWTDVAWVVQDLGWISGGENTLAVTNLEEGGEIGTPPWVLLTSATVYYD
ncbi:MAG: protein kinase [Thermomicrobiales bacterium]